MNDKITKTVSIASLVIFIVSVIVGRMLPMTGNIDLLLTFYRILLAGILPVTSFVGCIIIALKNTKVLPFYAVLAAIICYLIPLLIGMYASDTGSFEISIVMIAFAVVPVIAGVAVGLVVRLIRKSVTHS